MMVVAKQSSRHKMWTEITRPKYEREGQRYASDLTEAEWALIEPYMPAIKRLGRPRATELRNVLDAILYMARTGCQWRMQAVVAPVVEIALHGSTIWPFRPLI